MTGLRERQKAGRRRDILAAASQLFARNGFADTSVEAIAALAEVGTGTVYNYFSSKGDLLMALVALDGEQVRARGKRFIAGRHADPATALYGLLAIYIDHSLVHLTKELWRNAMATALTQADSPFGIGYFENDRLLAEQVGELVAVLQADGSLKSDIDAAQAGSALFIIVNGLFMQFVAQEKMPKTQLHARLRAQVALFVAGLSAETVLQRKRA
ncbi:TetR family transcriptional regulator [Dongia mobilis]|uniref:TetR family transcriptional regulator n=1 Tax=Dongia mobilis TaxID=578943 RepID=A0A4R6WQT5_9PROT|nr:TetR/AcrR family transcriptional regulator [Dongia mobilis]TDQ81554.1 TetR family transcriptional regulator [Dongia mobilis]